MTARSARIIPKSPPPGPWRLRGGAAFPFGELNTRLTRNGRTAIVTGLRALAIPPGARILVPSWHCGSEIDAILAADAVPVAYRLAADFSADLDHLADLLAQGGAWAIYVIHFFGYPQPVAPLGALADRHGAHLIEDLALGLYSTGADGQPLGRTGAMSVFSLVKTLAVPDGGALWLAGGQGVTRTGAPPLRATLGGLRSILRRRNPGQGPLRDRFADTPQSALDEWDSHAGISADAPLARASGVTRAMLQLSDHQRIAAQRAATYDVMYRAMPASRQVAPLMPPRPAGAVPAYFPLRVADPDAACAALAGAGVEVVRFWRRFHPAMDLSDFPEIIALKRQVLRLPVHHGVDDDAIARIARALT